MNPTISIVGAGALMAAAAILSGCSQSADAQNGLSLNGSKYCSAFKTGADTTSTSALSAALSDPGGAFDDCIHRWGYALAPARASADVVAQAAVDACGPILSAWSQQTGGEPQNAPESRYDRRGAQQAMQQPSPAQQQIRQAEAKALFYVVQARAAGCQPPPANTLLAANNNTGG
jgi:hypothetical protein